MSCYVVGLIHLKDAEAFAQYRDQVAASLRPYAGEAVARADFDTFLFNETLMSAPDALALLRFPDTAAARAWADGPEYQRLLGIRGQAMALSLLSFG